MASSRRAHQVLWSGLPSGRARAPLLPIHPTSVNLNQSKGEAATSLHQGLPPQEGATSPRGAHLLYSHVLKSKGFAINQISIKYILSPLTS